MVGLSAQKLLILQTNTEITLDQLIWFLFTCDVKSEPIRNIESSMLTNLMLYVCLLELR